MKRIIIAFLALLAFGGWVGEAQAAEPTFVGPYGERFCDSPIKDAADLETRFAKSLAADATGHRVMAGCKARPVDFLVVFQQDDPTAGLTAVSDLVSYAHDMKATEAQKDYEYTSACLWSQSDGTLAVKLDCVTREVRKGEAIFASRTGKLVLMSSCANPGVIPVPMIVVNADCVRVEFPSFKGRNIRVAYIGNAALPGRCTKLEVAGVDEPFVEMPQECPMSYTKEIVDSLGHKRLMQVTCSWTAVEQRASELLGYSATVQNVSGSFVGRKDGINVLYLPKEALNGEVVVCYDDDFQSYGVRRKDYLRNIVATIPLSVVTH